MLHLISLIYNYNFRIISLHTFLFILIKRFMFDITRYVSKVLYILYMAVYYILDKNKEDTVDTFTSKLRRGKWTFFSKLILLNYVYQVLFYIFCLTP